MTPPARSIHLLTAVTLTMTLGGCRSWVQSSTVIGSPHAAPGAPARIEVERVRGRVHMLHHAPGTPPQTAPFCRATRVQPRVTEVSTTHEMGVGGWFGQFVLAGGALGLSGGGAYLLTDSCNAASLAGMPCVEQAQDVNDTIGGAALATGGTMALLFVANAIGAIDTSEEVDAAPEKQSGPWHVCRPGEGAPR